MIITNYSFKETISHDGRQSFWEIKDLQFDKLNLIVGKNASGKTKTIDSLKHLSEILSGRINGLINFNEWKIELTSDEDKFNYKLKIRDGIIEYEELIHNNETKIKREKSGIGEIFYAAENKNVKFQVAENIIAALLKRDSIQHPYLDKIFEWANNLSVILFASDLSKREVVVTTDSSKNLGKTILGAFPINKDDKKRFSSQIIADLAEVGYEIELIDNKAKPIGKNITINLPMSGEVICLGVKEKYLDLITDQYSMSNGMYRTIFLVIYINYLIHNNKSGTILIDDIGEGLDFGRCSALIKLLTNKITNKPIQLIMSSNDQFVMNSVPLEAIIYLKREQGKIQFYNIHNANEPFEKFEFTGLSNFDFFATDFAGSYK